MIFGVFYSYYYNFQVGETPLLFAYFKAYHYNSSFSTRCHKRRKKKITCGARASVIGERGYNEIYIFVYAYS
jgi:hypothetical protein